MTITKTNTIHSSHFSFSRIWTEIVRAKNSDDRKTFNELMLGSLYDLNKYVARRLKVSIKKGELPANKYQVEEFIDTVFTEAYDHILKLETSTQFVNWMYKKTDELLEDTIVEEEFNDLFYENMDNYSKLEWDEMEENYSVDSDGDLIMEEELNDPSYPDHDYTLSDVFVANEEPELIEKLDEDLLARQVNQHIRLAVHNLPFDERVPFEMNVAHKIDAKDIAHIQNKEPHIVLENLQKARTKLANSFKTRFSIL